MSIGDGPQGSDSPRIAASQEPLIVPLAHGVHLDDDCPYCKKTVRIPQNHGPGRCIAEIMRPEAVGHPQHYGGDTVYEVIKVLAAWGLEDDALLWNSAKYIARAGKKGDKLEDLKKAQFYLNRRIAELETA